jgi:hypothetical protein
LLLYDCQSIRSLPASSAKDLIGKTDFDFWSVETARGTAADEQRIMKTREPLVGKIERLVHRDGKISWDYTTKMPLLDTCGEVIGICGINKDFTAIEVHARCPGRGTRPAQSHDR